MAKSQSNMIIQNKDLQAFFKILRRYNSPYATELTAVAKQISTLETHLETAVNELATMRTQLAEMQAKNHPVQTTLENAVITMQNQVLSIRDKLTELKNNFIEGCKNAVESFKEKGIAALDNVARFFKIKPAIEALRDDLNKSIQHDDKVIAIIETASTEYHEAGRHLKNMGRAIIGREPIQAASPNGKLSQTLTAPYRAERKCFTAMKGCAEKALASLSRLEERAGKTSIQGDIAKYTAKIAQAQKAAPAPERPIPANAER